MLRGPQHQPRESEVVWEDSSAVPKLCWVYPGGSCTSGCTGNGKGPLQQRMQLWFARLGLQHWPLPHAAAQLRSPPALKQAGYRCFLVLRNLNQAQQTQESGFC